jgi:glycine C-acetyltransferase
MSITTTLLDKASPKRPQLAHLTAQLDDLRARGTYFKLRVLDDAQAPVCHYDGREVINLASNNWAMRPSKAARSSCGGDR